MKLLRELKENFEEVEQNENRYYIGSYARLCYLDSQDDYEFMLEEFDEHEIKAKNYEIVVAYDVGGYKYFKKNDIQNFYIILDVKQDELSRTDIQEIIYSLSDISFTLQEYDINNQTEANELIEFYHGERQAIEVETVQNYLGFNFLRFDSAAVVDESDFLTFTEDNQIYFSTDEHFNHFVVWKNEKYFLCQSYHVVGWKELYRQVNQDSSLTLKEMEY